MTSRFAHVFPKCTRTPQLLDCGGRATVKSMQVIVRGIARLLIGVAAAAVFVTTVNGQASPGEKPSEANHFIGTPAGWVHPKTAWGDPDLQGMWPIGYVGS